MSPRILWVNTTPKMNVPSTRKTKLSHISIQLFFRKNDGSCSNVLLKRQMPGNIKMKTAARLPSILMTSPIFGIRTANRSDKKNQTVTQTHRTIISLRRPLSSFIEKTYAADANANPGSGEGPSNSGRVDGGGGKVGVGSSVVIGIPCRTLLTLS